MWLTHRVISDRVHRLLVTLSHFRPDRFVQLLSLIPILCSLDQVPEHKADSATKVKIKGIRFPSVLTFFHFSYQAVFRKIFGPMFVF